MHGISKYIWAVIFGVIIFLTFNKHSKSSFGTYQYTVWADKSGYYVFLPMLFNYNFDAEKMPKLIENKVGNGFYVDTLSDKIITKYNCGVSMMQAPFYALSKWSPYYEEMDKENNLIPREYNSGTLAFIKIGSAVFFTLALFLLYSSLRVYFSKSTVMISLMGFVLGSNLFYYAINENLMTHVYSFFWFSVALYSCVQVFKRNEQSLKYWIYLCLAAGFIVLLRPTNILFLVALVIVFYSKDGFQNYFKKAFLVKGLWAVVILVCVFLPQMLYWNYAYGSLVVDTYSKETFSNWNNPYLLETLFSPNNGVFLYSPILIISLIGVVVMIIKKANTRWVLALILSFVVLIYLTASWWTYDFGCGFGSRNFVEYSVLFIFPIAYLLERSKPYKVVHYSILTVMVVMVVFITQLTYVFDECWFGKDNWDFAYYWDFVF